MSLRKSVGLLLLLLLVVAGGVFWWRVRQTRTPEKPVLSPVKVRRGPIVQKVPTTGRIVPNLEVEIKCKASGEIVKLPFDVSDSVRQGELLLELDPVDEERLVRQAEVSLHASEARLAQARQNLALAERGLATARRRAEAALRAAEAGAADARAKAERLQQLLEKKLASQEEYDTAATAAVQASVELENARIRLEEVETEAAALELKRQDVRLAEAQVEADTLAVEQARQRLRDTKVFAPINGVVTVRNVQVGQIISSGISNVGGGTTILTLSDLSRLFVLASVDESDIGKVQTGQTVRITADAFPEREFTGRVVRVATRGVNTSNVVTFEVKIEVLGEDKALLKPEMTANVEITCARREDALLVPGEAVKTSHGRRTVLLDRGNGRSEERVVQTGLSDGVNVEVTEGLDGSETVLVSKEGAESRWRGARDSRPPMPPMFMPGMGRPRR